MSRAAIWILGSVFCLGLAAGWQGNSILKWAKSTCFGVVSQPIGLLVVPRLRTKPLDSDVEPWPTYREAEELEA